jgi:hypothetical protein
MRTTSTFLLVLGLAAWPGRPAAARGPQPDTTQAPAPERDHSGPDKRTRLLESAAFDLVSGGSRRGDWALELSGGFPWQRVRVQVGVGKRLTPLVEMDTTLGRRIRPAAGLSLRWVDRPHVRLSGEVLLGWDWQLTPDRRRRGPNGELRVRLAFPIGRVAPYLVLGTRHTLLMDRTSIETASGTDISWDARQAWILWGSLGLAVAITENVGLDLGIDLPWVDPPTPSIPGFHLGLILGGWGGRQ